MSSNVLKLVPISPKCVPHDAAQKRAHELLISYFPKATQVTITTTEQVHFIDAGSNWGRIFCPACGSELDTQIWQQAMDAAYETEFMNLLMILPCCGATYSLNDLRYEWPVGFARFVIAIHNPNTDLDSDKMHLVEQILGCALRKIWAHY